MKTIPATPVYLGASALLALVATSAHARTWLSNEGNMTPQAYIRAEGGWNYTDDNSYGTSVGQVNTKYDSGYMAGGAVGMQTGPMRYEVEAFQNKAKVKSLSAAGIAQPGANGSMQLGAVMGNVYYDFGSHNLKPYIGGGVGMGRLKADNQRSSFTTYADDSDTVLAYQGMAGVKYDLTPNWAVNGEYRYIGTNDGDISTLGGGTRKISYDSNNVILGLTYKF
jgi:opacity protein-like surface antigen